MKNNTIGGIMLTTATLIWGTSLVAQRLAAGNIGPFTFNSVRFLIGTLTLLPVILITDYHKSKIQTSNNGFKAQDILNIKGGLICGCILFAAASLQQTGIAYTTVGKAGFITALYIVIVPVLGLFLGRHLIPQIWICIFLAAFGMYLLCINEKFTLGLGDALVLLCAFSTAIHILSIDYFSSRVDCMKLSCLQFLICGILSSAAAFMFEKPDIQSLISVSGPIIYTGILSCGIAYTLQTFGQKYVSPVTACMILSFESVFSALFGWIILKETLKIREIFGCILIFIAIAASQLTELWKYKAKKLR